jgi:hypothetical protein
MLLVASFPQFAFLCCCFCLVNDWWWVVAVCSSFVPCMCLQVVAVHRLHLRACFQCFVWHSF